MRQDLFKQIKKYLLLRDKQTNIVCKENAAPIKFRLRVGSIMLKGGEIFRGEMKTYLPNIADLLFVSLLTIQNCLLVSWVRQGESLILKNISIAATKTSINLQRKKKNSFLVCETLHWTLITDQHHRKMFTSGLHCSDVSNFCKVLKDK